MFLVTGHQGYVGSVLVPLLLEVKHEVIGLDSGFFRECVLGQEYSQVTTIFKDIREVTSDDLLGVYAIIHLAGVSFSGGDWHAARRTTSTIMVRCNWQASPSSRACGASSRSQRMYGAPATILHPQWRRFIGKAPDLVERFIGRFLEEDISRLASSGVCAIVHAL